MPADLALGPLPKPAAGTTIWVAYSGGLDSTVLLHRLHATGLPIKAVHVNHHLQSASGRWADHCREFCSGLGVSAYVMDVRIEPGDPLGPEAAARRVRYSAFQSLMKPGDWLATAHHQDDQAETVLLRLLRGSGVTGLAAMRARRPFAAGELWRPLLGRSRAELHAYAEARQLHWIEDPHNLDTRFSRTFVRHELFPRLQQRWPQAVEMLARSAAHCAEAVSLLDELAAADIEKCRGADGLSLSVRQLLRLRSASRSNALRYWVAGLGFEAPPFDAVERIDREVLRARMDASPLLGWGNAELRRFRDSIYLMKPLPALPGSVSMEWSGQHDLELPPGCGTLKVDFPARVELPLRVRFVRGGERIKPLGARFTRTLRNLFQEAGIPAWVRERVPLLEYDRKVIAVADLWATAQLTSESGLKRFRFSWQHSLAGAKADLKSAKQK